MKGTIQYFKYQFVIYVKKINKMLQREKEIFFCPKCCKEQTINYQQDNIKNQIINLKIYKLF